MVSILPILILPVRNKGVSFFLINGQNPLSVTKVICRQSIKTWKLEQNKFLYHESWSSTLTVTLEQFKWLEPDSHVQPGLLNFLRNLFFKKNLKYGWSMDSDAIVLNFLKKLDSIYCSMWVLERAFDVINSNSWFLANIKSFQVWLYSS